MFICFSGSVWATYMDICVKQEKIIKSKNKEEIK